VGAESARRTGRDPENDRGYLAYEHPPSAARIRRTAFFTDSTHGRILKIDLKAPGCAVNRQ
jgi:hypothetical protein